MSERALVRSVALFYFFSLDNESSARVATIKALDLCKTYLRKNNRPLEDAPVALVHLSNKNWEKFRQIKGKKALLSAEDLGWKVPGDVDLGVWKQFQKEAELEEFLAVLWSKIIGISDRHIAEGLGVTTGTVRHRVSRGLRQLSQLGMF